MYLSFGRKLRGLGYIHLGVRRRNIWLVLTVYLVFYVFWYSLLAALWLAYGMGYLFYYLPAKGIVKLCKHKRSARDSEYKN